MSRRTTSTESRFVLLSCLGAALGMTVVVIDTQDARSVSDIQQASSPLLAPRNTPELVDCGRFRGVSGDPITGIAYQERTILDDCTLANSDRGSHA
jgi:hypothetical protein